MLLSRTAQSHADRDVRVSRSLDVSDSVLQLVDLDNERTCVLARIAHLRVEFLDSVVVCDGVHAAHDLAALLADSFVDDFDKVLN